MGSLEMDRVWTVKNTFLEINEAMNAAGKQSAMLRSSSSPALGWKPTNDFAIERSSSASTCASSIGDDSPSCPSPTHFVDQTASPAEQTSLEDEDEDEDTHEDTDGEFEYGMQKEKPGMTEEEKAAVRAKLEETHAKGLCKPCLYFHFKADGCRAEQCLYCHQCTRDEILERRKQHKRMARAARKAEHRGRNRDPLRMARQRGRAQAKEAKEAKAAAERRQKDSVAEAAPGGYGPPAGSVASPTTTPPAALRRLGLPLTTFQLPAGPPAPRAFRESWLSLAPVTPAPVAQTSFGRPAFLPTSATAPRSTDQRRPAASVPLLATAPALTYMKVD